MTTTDREPHSGLETDLANRLHSAAIHLLRRARRDDPLSGTSPARLSALSVVGFGGPVTISDLAAAEGVSVPTISRIVAALEGDGLIDRHADTRDARIAHLTATEKGLRVLREGRARRTTYVGEMLRELSPQELEAVEKAVAALERHLGGPH
jgi:DNA-binding MarR family transcriptional regulator